MSINTKVINSGKVQEELVYKKIGKEKDSFIKEIGKN